MISLYLNYNLCLYSTGKEERTEPHNTSKAKTKLATSQPTASSSAIAKSDHLMNLNLDIGSMVEVGSGI